MNSTKGLEMEFTENSDDHDWGSESSAVEDYSIKRDRLQICRVCLLTECRLYSITELNLSKMFRQVTGVDNDQLIDYLCAECALFLKKCERFKQKTLTAQKWLDVFTELSHPVPDFKIEMVNRNAYKLASNLTKKSSTPNYYDIVIYEDYEEIKPANYFNTNLKREFPSDTEENSTYERIKVEFEADTSKTEMVFERNDNRNVKTQHESDNSQRNDYFHTGTKRRRGRQLENVKVNVYNKHLNNKGSLEDKFNKACNPAVKVIQNGDLGKYQNQVYPYISEEVEIPSTDFNIGSELKAETTLTDLNTGAEYQSAYVHNFTNFPERDGQGLEITIFHDPAIINDEEDGNDQTYNDNSQTYNDNDQTYNDNSQTYNDNSQTYNDNSQTYNDNSQTYNDNSQTYNDNDQTYIEEDNESIVLDQPVKTGHPSVWNFLRKNFRIKKLTLDEQRAFFQNRIEKYKNCPFKCDVCYKGFLLKNALESHMERHSMIQGEHACEVCHYHFKEHNLMRDHQRLHYNLYSCLQCPFATTNSDMARTHLLSHQGTTFACHTCDRIYTKETSYFAHLRVHHPSSKHVCTLCGYSFASEHGLRLHHKLKHSHDDLEIPPEGPHCFDCSLQFKSEEALSTHLKISPVHNSPHPKVKKSVGRVPDSKKKHLDNPVVCEVCGKVVRQRFLKAHAQQHSGEMFPCDECNKVFTSGTRLQHHKYVNHNKTKGPPECQVCGKHFSSSGNLNKHYERLHTNKATECPICKKVYKLPEDLKQHTDHVHNNKPWRKKTKKNQKP